ncbi:MAG: SAM-dependent methyltransferase [Bacteroidetes bacterium HGW-Bacteroidetes-15]|nr:MAG: SAM-dependent methyltransferase [Bacteroidetes bacterium HGW-Bacteroidetes-15]
MKGNEEWNQRYSKIDCAYGVNPNNFLGNQLVHLTPGDLLLPGEGEGRNALWAAKQGWNVTAFDYSDEAKKKADALFKKNGVEVEYLVTDVLSFKSKKSFDAIALIYFHLPSLTRKKFFSEIQNYIKPGGYLIMECFHPDQIPRSSGGPKNPDLLPSIEEIKESFKNLHIKELAKVEIDLNEGELHQGKALVIRLLAQKNGAE